MSKDYANRLLILFRSFFRISAVSIGGGLAMLPLMSREYVEKRKWMTDEEMVDVVAVVQSVPGIIAFNMSVMIGYRIAGFAGALVSTLGVALPPFLAIVLLASCFQKLQENLLVIHIFSGVRACVAALILLSVIKMGKTVFRGIAPRIITVLSFLSLFVFHANAIALIIISGIVGILISWNGRSKETLPPAGAFLPVLAASGSGAGTAASFGFGKLFFLFAKIGIFTFGGGYAMVPLFQDELITKHHFLTADAFANLVSLAQVTPGPVGLNAATYIGYQCGIAQGNLSSALTGAVIGTLGVMVPSFLIVLWAAVFLKAYQQNFYIRSILSGIRPATLGLIACAVIFFLETSAFRTPLENLFLPGKHFELCWQGCVIFLLTFAVSWRFRTGMIFLLLGSAVLSALIF